MPLGAREFSELAEERLGGVPESHPVWSPPKRAAVIPSNCEKRSEFIDEALEFHDFSDMQVVSSFDVAKQINPELQS